MKDAFILHAHDGQEITRLSQQLHDDTLQTTRLRPIKDNGDIAHALLRSEAEDFTCSGLLPQGLALREWWRHQRATRNEGATSETGVIRVNIQ